MAVILSKRLALASLSAAIMVLLAPAIHAQSNEEDGSKQKDASKASKAVTLEAVVVTSQKRQQKLQDVPIAITALQGDQIETRNIESARDLNGTTPGLVTTPDPAYHQQPQMYIRGMGQSAVSVYLDGVYLDGTFSNVMNIVDLTRIEVLRGPQGTLYGRNSMAGAINLITAKPSGTFNGYVSLSAGNYNAMRQKLYVDLPQLGIFKASISALSNHRDGWIHSSDQSLKPSVNDKNDTSFRLDVIADISPSFTAEFTLDRSKIHNNGVLMQVYSVNDAFFNMFGFNNVSQYGSRERMTVADIDGDQFFNQKTGGQSLTLAWRVNDNNDIKSITGYRSSKRFANPDEDGTPYPIVVSHDPIPPGLSLANSGYSFNDPLQQDRYFSQELQWVGHTDKIDYVMGLYHFNSDGRSGGTSSYFGLSHSLSKTERKNKSDAAYAQIDYSPIDPLTLTIGIRTNRDTVTIANRVYGCRGRGACTPPAGMAYNIIIPPGTRGSTHYSASSPALAAKWKFSESFMVYSRYATGYRAGGYNSGGYSNMSTEENIRLLLTPYRPEKAKSLEFGSKATLFGGRLQGDIALFRTKYSDLQKNVFDAATFTTTTLNAAKATIRGLEVQAAFKILPGTTLRGNYARLLPRYDAFYSDDKITGLPHNYADDRAFSFAPPVSYGVSLDSQLARFDWGTLDFHGDFHYTGTMYMSAAQLKRSGPEYDPASTVAEDSKVKGYGLLNMQLGLSQLPLGPNAVGRVSLWCQNCADKSVPVNLLDFGPSFGNLVLANFTAPRTFGVGVSVHW